jgi:hypothetical protein
MEPAVEEVLTVLRSAGYSVTLAERRDGSWYAIARQTKTGEVRAVSGRTAREAVTLLVRVLGLG